ncbi:MAG: 2-C-methyl-D-erythritol 2,4-cyclodiphosphate synthase [Candidatus Omnitrophica bacterium]|nr:2-C-methyl-D-erythritol 2,4-cyclodiphosphate synthase [Candidatus Omnitrophota bacterium]
MSVYRIGIGYDIHALQKGDGLPLGGVRIPFDRSFNAHSDGDVLLHAVCDAILGAMGKGDIGMMFPDTDPSFKDADSRTFLERVSNMAAEHGYSLGNLDCVIVAQEPKISPHSAEIRGSIAQILRTSEDKINLKAKTAEKLGPVGEGKAIEAHAVVLLEK